MKEPNDDHELDLIVEFCKVCYNAAKDRTFGFPICEACKMFVFQCLRSKTTHKPCQRNKKFIFDFSTIKECSCCHLRKCIYLNMDPYYETRQEINNALRRSFPFYPCPTCNSNISPVSKELNQEDYKNPCEDGFQIHSDGKRDDSLTASSSLPYKLCKVCGYKAEGNHYSALSCSCCYHFFRNQVLSKKAHGPCSGKRQCIITGKNRSACRCCRLKKCLTVGMDPAMVKNVLEIHYDSIMICEPMEWFVLLSCETCDFKRIEAINESIQDLKSFCMKMKKKSTKSSAASSKEVTDFGGLLGLSVNKSDVSLYGSNFQVDFDLKRFTTSDIGDSLNETNLNHSGSTLFTRDDTEHISNSSVYSGTTGGHLPSFTSIRSVKTVENHDAISFKNDSLVETVKKSDVSLYGSNFQVINDHRLNFLSTFTVSSSQSPNICERMDPVIFSGENATVTELEGVTEDTIQRQFENDMENCLKPLDFDLKRFTTSDIGDSLKETNLNHSGSTLFTRDDTGHISNSSVYSGTTGGRLPSFASIRSAKTVENHDAISFKNGSLVESGKKSDVSLYGSNLQVINDHRLNFSNTFNLSSCPDVCERINQVNSSGENATEKKTNDFESIDMTSFKELIRQNSNKKSQN